MYTLPLNSKQELRDIENAIFTAAAALFNSYLSTDDTNESARLYAAFEALENVKHLILDAAHRAEFPANQ